MAVSAQFFFQHVDGFFDYRKSIYEISDQTMKSNQIDLNLFKDFVYDRQYQTINGNVAMEFQYYLKKQRQNSGGSINRKIFTLRIYSKYLVFSDVEQADKLPFHNILKIKQGYLNRPGALTHDQVNQLFETIDRTAAIGIRDYAVYGCMYQLGLRVGEVHALDLENIDLENKTVTVIGKGNKRRTLPLKNEMTQIITEWLAVRKKFLNSDIEKGLFISKKGNRLAIRTMEDNFKKLVEKSTLTAHFNITCHTLRHTFASHLNDEGTDILVLQSLLGHASTKSTQAYIHPSEKKVRQEMEKLPGVLYMNQLIDSGVLPISFQASYKQQRE